MIGAVAREAGLRYARANVLLAAGGEVAGLYRLRAVNYPLLAVGDKWLVQRRLERLARVVGADFSLWRVTRGPDTRLGVAHQRGVPRGVAAPRPTAQPWQ